MAVDDLLEDPEFPTLPLTDKLQRFETERKQDPAFRSMSDAGQTKVYDMLFSQVARGQAVQSMRQPGGPQPQPPEVEKQWRISLTDPTEGIQPAQEGGVQQAVRTRTTAPEPQNARDLSTPMQAVLGTSQGLAQGVDEAVMGIPAMVQAGVTGIANAVAEPFGYSIESPQPGTLTHTIQRAVLHPVETLLAGPEGFPVLDSVAKNLQDLVRQTSGVMLSSRVMAQAVPALRMTPMTWAEAVTQSTVGTIGKRVGEMYDGPYAPVIGELVGALTAQLGVDGAKKVWQDVLSPAAQATKALGASMGTTGKQVVLDHIAEADHLQQLVPGLRLSPFQKADTPELLAVQQTLEKQQPELAQQLRLWRVENQRLLQQAFGDTSGAGGMATQDAMQLVIDGLRLPYQQQQKLYESVLAQNEGKLALANADLLSAQQAVATAQGLGAQAERQAQAQLSTATQAVTALKERSQDLQFAVQDTKQAFAMDRAALLAAAEKTAQARLARTPGGQVPLTYPERLEATVKVWREHFEQRFQAFREEAGRLSDLVDPNKIATTPASAAQKVIDKQRAQFRSEGIPEPSALHDLETIIEQARVQQKGVTDPLLSFQDVRNMYTRLYEDASGLPYGTRAKTFVLDAGQDVKDLLRKAARDSGDPGVFQRYEKFGEFYAKNIKTFREGPGDVLLSVKYLPKGGRTGAVLPEEYYDLTHGQALSHLWSNTPIPGNPGRSSQTFFNQYKALSAELERTPAGLQARRDFIAHDFYEHVVDPTTGLLDQAKATTWVRDHRAQLDLSPDLKAAYADTRNQLAELARTKRDATKLLDQLEQDKLATRQQLAQTQRGPLAQAEAHLAQTRATATSDIESATVGVAQAKDVLATVATTAKQDALQAEKQVQQALAEWQDATGSSRAAAYALQRTAATDALGATPQDIVAAINQQPANRRAFALGRATESIKQDPQAVDGLWRALWEDYVKTHADPGAPAALVAELPLADPTLVLSWLRDYEGWFKRYKGIDHYNDLVSIAKGMRMNQLAGATSEASVPAALKAMTPMTRMFHRASVGVALGGPAYMIGGGGWGLGGVLTGATVIGATLDNLLDRQRLALLESVVTDPQTARLVAMLGRGKGHPVWTGPALAHALTKLGMAAGTRGGEVSDAQAAAIEPAAVQP